MFNIVPMIEIKVNKKDPKKIEIDGGKFVVDNEEYTPDLVKVTGGGYHMILNGNNKDFDVSVKDENDLLLEEMGLDAFARSKVNDVKAPMPGMVLKVLVEEGQEISKGDNLLVLEAMKMENIIKSPGDGTVKSIGAQIGKAVDKNQVLIELE